jgi:glycosyltransferase involved in cell wall biosynthesis
MTGRPVIVFPDPTNGAIGGLGSSLAEKLRRFAGGSPVVGCLGHLQPTKGATTLARVALDERYRRFCFAFIGTVTWARYSAADQEMLASVGERSPNSFAHFFRPDTEEAFNDVFRVCDLIYAAYIDFPHSSNILTKATVLERPVVVSDGYLMAERVRQYRLGEVVPENDPEASGRAIERILEDRAGWLARQRPRWAEYRERHGYAAVRAAFENLLRVGGGTR